MMDLTDITYEVTFTNAINGNSARCTFDNVDDAQMAAEEYRPFNNTRVTIREVPQAASHAA